jgi:hypothetical protein
MELKIIIIFNCYGVKNNYPSSKLQKKGMFWKPTLLLSSSKEASNLLDSLHQLLSVTEHHRNTQIKT